MKLALAFLLTLLSAPLVAKTDAPSAEASDKATDTGPLFTPSEVKSTGAVTAGGKRIAYQAVAGTIVVHPKDWQDTDARERKADPDAKDETGDKVPPTAEASMFYTAYFKAGAAPGTRPITFVFNGGPGSSTVWLHMGAFGPVRVQTSDHAHTPAAPYSVVNNDDSLLDVSDVVFVDAPGAGFSRVAGKDKDKAFFGVDQDIHAFADFIAQFLTKYGRWNAPKYVFGESYGTMRAAGLALALQEQSIDLNGVMLLSDVLAWDLVPDDPQDSPSIDLPYIVTLPTYAATAWYHNRIANRPADLRGFLDQVETFATTDYALALLQGNALPPERRQAIAERLAAYTGLPVAYILKTNLRIEYGAFQKEMFGDQALTTGTLDTRFTGATLDPLSKVAQYDPQSAALESAYVAAFNAYARDTLHYGADQTFKPVIDVYDGWDFRHQTPGAKQPLIALPNVMPDLATAMKVNPGLKVMVNGGYFDVSTPYFAGWYELHHLPVPASLQGNIEYHYYQSGHMVYAHLPALHELHANVADFIRRTDNLEAAGAH